MFRYSAACLILSARGLVGAQIGDVITCIIYIPERALVKLKFTYVNSSAQPCAHCAIALHGCKSVEAACPRFGALATR